MKVFPVFIIHREKKARIAAGPYLERGQERYPCECLVRGSHRSLSALFPFEQIHIQQSFNG